MKIKYRTKIGLSGDKNGKKKKLLTVLVDYVVKKKMY